MNSYNYILDPLEHFVFRTQMYLPSVSRDTIVSFLSGYSLLKKPFLFFENIRSYLKDNFGIVSESLSWAGLIDEYSKHKAISWVASFKKISLDIFANQDNVGNTDLHKATKFFIANQISYFSYDYFNKNSNWMDNWIGVVAYDKQWFKDLFSNKELSLIKEINNEVYSIYLNSVEEDRINNLLLLKYEFEKIIS